MQFVRSIRLGYGLPRHVFWAARSTPNSSNIFACEQVQFRHDVRNRHFSLCCITQIILPKHDEGIVSSQKHRCYEIHSRDYQTSRRSRNQEKSAKSATDLQSETKSTEAATDLQPEKKLTLYQRYKKMLKEYWYIMIPVHMVTSTMWFGMFYYVAASGFDIIPYLEMLSLPESIIKPLRNPLLGYIAVASALYKIASPARYMVTLGGSTMTIKYLTKRGLIKPVPTKDKFKSIIKNKLQSAKDS